ncbi:subtilisin-like protein [Gloeopeniophorella convolvens]|nr:subtilisin-like protein [Gloeopeniophorella convolvens]
MLRHMRAMAKSLLVISALIPLIVVRARPAHDARMHERRASVPNGFTLNGPAPGNTPLELRIALTQNDVSGLEDALMAVSTPGNERYGKHLSKEEVGMFITPKPETMAAVNHWLASNGLNATIRSPYGDWLGIQTTVSNANELFRASFMSFSHDGTGTEAIRTMAYAVPASLEAHINLVHPTITFPDLRRSERPALSSVARHVPTSNISTRAAPAACHTVLTPTCLQELYNIPATPAVTQANRIGVLGFADDFANTVDLEQFVRTTRPDLVTQGAMFSLVTVDGGTNPQGQTEAGIIANLDLQYTVGVASGVPVSFISVGTVTQDSLDGFLDVVNFLLDQDSPPQVIINSYGFNENQITQAMARTICTAYMQLGARGVSVVVSSGDGGVAGSQDANCSTFQPTFPSTCPFVTSVGATQDVNPEVAASFSSGGFSNYFDVPDYQEAASAKYLASLGAVNTGLFNKTGRGYPDVAAAGVDVKVVFQNFALTISGTSVSSPIFGSVIALINDRLMGSGRPPLGFLNPFLYSAKGLSGLNDITSGESTGCTNRPSGFPATAGWDPVTGLGSPNWANLLLAASE